MCPSCHNHTKYEKLSTQGEQLGVIQTWLRLHSNYILLFFICELGFGQMLKIEIIKRKNHLPIYFKTLTFILYQYLNVQYCRCTTITKLYSIVWYIQFYELYFSHCLWERSVILHQHFIVLILIIYILDINVFIPTIPIVPRSVMAVLHGKPFSQVWPISQLSDAVMCDNPPYYIFCYFMYRLFLTFICQNQTWRTWPIVQSLLC